MLELLFNDSNGGDGSSFLIMAFMILSSQLLSEARLCYIGVTSRTSQMSEPVNFWNLLVNVSI